MDSLHPGSDTARSWTLIVVIALLLALAILASGVAGPIAVAGETTASQNASVSADDSDPTAASVDPAVRNASGDVELILYLDTLPTSAIHAADDPVERLKSHSRSVQPPIRFALDQRDGVEVEGSSWLANSILVTVDLDHHSIDDIAAIDGVERVGENANVTALEARHAPGDTVASRTTDNTVASRTTDTEYTYGLEQIGVPDAWTEHDTRGEGVRVAVVDTGIDATHPDLDLFTEDPDDPTYPGGWAEFDHRGNVVEGSTPYDTGQHGTHVSGTVAAGDGSGTHVGVAPDVELMHALGIDADEGGTTAQVIASVEWAVANDADVVSLSLGSSRAVPADVTWVRNTKATGTHVVAASGNDGAGTASSPGLVHDALSVGATDRNRQVPSFSSGDTIETVDVWGTAAPKGWPDSYVVPDVVAPGVRVPSTVPNEAYAESSGTSMATPHVTGALALLIAASDDPDLTPVAYERALIDSATKPDGGSGTPDDRYGSGIIDVPAAITRLDAYDGGVHGTVTDADGEPLSGVDVRTDTGVRTVTSEAGTYRLNATAGDTTVTATKFGYGTHARATTVPESGGVTENFALEQTVEATVISDVPRFVESGDSYSGTFRLGNVDAYTVTVTDDSTIDPDAVDITFGETDITLGEPLELDERISDGSVRLTVHTDEAVSNDTLALEHTFEGAGDRETVTTRETRIKSELRPANVEITSFETTERIPEDGVVVVNATAENVGERAGTRSIDYRVVGNETDASVGLGTFEFEPTETVRLEREIDASALSPGEYVQSVDTGDDTRERPLVVVEQGVIALGLEPAETTGTNGTEHEFDVVASDPFGGIASYDLAVSIDDPNVSRIVAFESDRPSETGSVTISEDGSTARLEQVLDEPYEPTEEAVIGSVTVALDDPGNATIGFDDDPLVVDLDDRAYSIRSTETATISVVRSPDGVDVTGDGTPATDTTGDGRLNDINGDGQFTIVDVQLFFQVRNADAVQNNVDRFDFSGNGRVGIADVQALFEQLRTHR